MKLHLGGRTPWSAADALVGLVAGLEKPARGPAADQGVRPPVCILAFILAAGSLFAQEDGFTPLFNGKDLTGWRASENTQAFSVKEGAIMAHGPRSHCFYVGDFAGHSFRDFELKVDVMTLPRANGGVYFATDFQDSGRPLNGSEVQ